MADKLLKSITFPDLTDKYIIGDSSLSETGAAADAKATGDALATKANIDGSYENLTAGTANQINTSVRANDKTPYIFRTSGGSVDIGDREYINGIVGGTVAWNQLVQNGNFASTSNWQTIRAELTVSNNVATMTAGATDAEHYIEQTFTTIAGHIYCVLAELKTDGSQWTFRTHYNGTSASRAKNYSDTTWLSIGFVISNTTSATTNRVRYITDVENSVANARNVMVFDLTQMFGSTIADYIYSLEQATAGAGVAWFRKLFPKPYYAYNAGELKSVSGLVSHDMTGFNQWDEEWEVGAINSATGEKVSASNRLRTKNFIPVLPNTTYFFNSPLGYYADVYEYSGKNEFPRLNILYKGGSDNVNNNIFTTGSNTHALMFVMNEAYGTTYKNDICINISWDGSRNGEYEPYELHSYPLDSDLTLRGIPKLDADNKLYYDGDTYESDGTVTRRFNQIDLKDFNLVKNNNQDADDWLYYAILSGAKHGVLMSEKYAVADRFPILGSAPTGTNGGNAAFAYVNAANAGIFYVNMYGLISENTKASAEAYFDNHSTLVVYPLETPTTETADPYVSPQIVNDFGTEEYVIAKNTFAVPVGHDTDYPINMVAKLEMAPNSPDGNGDYIVRQTNGENTYVPFVIEDALPTMPSEAGTYKLTVTVTEGSDPVLSWEAE